MADVAGKKPSFEDYQDQLQDREQAVQDQLDRIYAMVEQGRPTPFVQVEFRRAVERITEKYQVLNALLDSQKDLLEQADFDDRAQALKDQFKEDVVLLAAAIDEASGANMAGEATGGQ